ncbi:MAG: LysM domain-containing protein, partial [Nocardioides sp.]
AVRRAVLLLCGAALTAGLAGPAGATGGAPAGPEVLQGLRLPERIGVEPPSPAPRPAAVATPRARQTVRPGDTLWSLSAVRLGADATTAEIAAAWPRLYAANRGVIGPDPAHIEPGQHLTFPADHPTEGTGHDRH